LKRRLCGHFADAFIFVVFLECDFTMDISGEFSIPALRERVWEALNDPDILARCIPGCESMERTDDNRFDAQMLAKVGPVKARFASSIELSNIKAPVSYTISGEGKGGPVGFGKGSAEVVLEQLEDRTTVLRYSADLQVGGKLAQIGSRLIGGAAKKIANDFFSKFVAEFPAD
jgi:carbon monoxide dehydrogenase subunit G